MTTTGPHAPAPLRLHLLRDFELRAGDDLVDVPPIAQRLIAFLALEDGRAVRRSRVSGHLWPEVPDSRAGASLRSAVWRCPAPEGRPVVDASTSHLRLHPDVEVDLHVSSVRGQRILALPSLDAGGADLAGDLAAFADDVLVTWYDEWVAVERERFRQLRLHVLDQVGELLLRARRYPEAVQVALVAVSTEPLRESTHRLLVRAHLCEGNLAEALRQYHGYASLLARELRVRPSAAMEDLVADALAQASTARWNKARLSPSATA